MVTSLTHCAIAVCAYCARIIVAPVELVGMTKLDSKPCYMVFDSHLRFSRYLTLHQGIENTANQNAGKLFLLVSIPPNLPTDQCNSMESRPTSPSYIEILTSFFQVLFEPLLCWPCWPLYFLWHGIKYLCNPFLWYTMEYTTSHL